MPQRVIDSEVKAIFKTSIDTQPFIQTASLLIDAHLVGQGLSTALLMQIELYLAAHLACARDPRMREASTESMTARFQRVQGGKGLDATEYGQTVKLLDSTGILDQILSTRRAWIKVD